MGHYRPTESEEQVGAVGLLLTSEGVGEQAVLQSRTCLILAVPVEEEGQEQVVRHQFANFPQSSTWSVASEVGVEVVLQDRHRWVP